MILVTGAGGFVGSHILHGCSNVLAAPSLRGATEEDIKRIIEENGVTAILHTAAVSDIGACEKDPDTSYTANVSLPVYLARQVRNIKLICFSSDQVYSGAKEMGPYTEDMAAAANVYASQKLEMEQRVLDIAPEAVMLRAEWMYGYYQKKSNYFMNMLHAEDTVAFSTKQYRGVTYIKEVCEQMKNVLRLPGGVYNFGSETEQSMHEITQAFLSYVGKTVRVTDAPPRHNLWMCCEKARANGVVFSSVIEGLRRCADDYAHLFPNR